MVHSYSPCGIGQAFGEISYVSPLRSPELVNAGRLVH